MNIFKENFTLSTDHFTGLLFGEASQLEVLGYYQIGYTKHYIVKCSLCEKDPELYSKGLFKSTLGHLKLGKIPCGCSKVPKWNEDQWITNASRAAQELGYGLEYNPDMLPFKGQLTRCNLTCKLHGSWNVPLSSVVQKRLCKKCSDTSGRSFKPDSVMIESFLATGVYHPDTIFYRSDRKTSQGAKNYWWLHCPVCDSTGEISTSCLQRGSQPCECVKNERQAYINLISDSGVPIAIKFGISKFYKNRVQKQNKKSIYEVTNIMVWEFNTKEACRASELKCKSSVSCGVISPIEMPDGHSETTSLNNIDIISSIFEEFGGVRYN